jgi:MtN3 and saliva related transmembrane protein
MDVVTIIGTGAAICSTISFAPQAWKIIQTGETKDISAISYAITVTAFALWVTYGAIRGDWPLLASNSVCLVLSAFILVMTLAPKAWRKKMSKAAS